MNLRELHPFRLRDAVEFHDELNPKLWWGDRLQPRVRRALLKIARDFVEYLGIDKLNIKDITISGSNAAYSYTDHSDIDLHLIVDMDNLNPDSVYRELFRNKKELYNAGRKITVHGIPVECYVQDKKQEHVTLGEYSIQDGKWLKYPTKSRSHYNEVATRHKYNKLRGIIGRAIKTGDSTLIDALLKKLKQYRSAGLERGGEFSPENLSYKAVKAQGTIDKLYKMRDRLRGRDLSIEGQHVAENVEQLYREFKTALHESQFDYSTIPTYDEYSNDVEVRDKFRRRVFKYCWYSQCSPQQIFEHVYRNHWSIVLREDTSSKKTSEDVLDLIRSVWGDSILAKNIKTGDTIDVVTVDFFGSSDRLSIRTQENKVVQDIRVEGNDVAIFFTDGDIAISNYSAAEYIRHVIFFTKSGAADRGIQWINLASERVNGVRNYRGFTIDLPSEGPYDRIMSSVRESQKKKHRTPTVEELAHKHGVSVGRVNRELKRGIAVELEHTASHTAAARIARDHLDERLDYYSVLKRVGLEEKIDEASGYIPSEAERHDRRWSTALSVDVGPDAIQRNARALGMRVTRDGRPPLLMRRK